MSEECFIRRSTFKKYHLISFFLALTQIIINAFNKYYPEDGKNMILELYSKSLGEILVIIIPHIKYFYISNKRQFLIKADIPKRIIALHYFILLFIYTIYISLTLVCYIVYNYNEDKSLFILLSENLSMKEGIEIIFITVTLIILLKYKFYMHHYLSIIFFIILTVSIDLILNNYSFLSNKDFLEHFVNIVCILSKIIYLCYIKYMLFKSHYFWNIMLFLGIMLLIINSIILLFIILSPKENTISFIKDFWDYFDNVPKGIIISKCIINFLLQFIYSVFEIFTIFYISPLFLLITYTLSKMFFILTNEYDYTKYICIIFFILQIFSLLIYLEILELNFLNLNKNTIRSITWYKPHIRPDYVEELEVDDDYDDRDDRDDIDDIEFERDYIIDIEQKGNDNNNEKNIEQTV